MINNKLDTAYTIETPEGVELELHLAGPVVRSGAWLLDALIRLAAYIVFAIVLSILGSTGIGIMLILFFLLEWFYPVVFELMWGATPGKRTFGLLVVHTNGTPISWQASITRNLLRAVDFLPIFYGFGLLATLSNQRFQRLGDMAAGTLVIYKPENQIHLATADHVPVAPPNDLTLKEQQALISFAERQPLLSASRSAELASHLAPITGSSDQQAVNTVLGYTQWLIKGR